MLQIFEKIKPLDPAPTSLSVTTAALSSTRAGRLCGLYTLHLYFYVFAEAVGRHHRLLPDGSTIRSVTLEASSSTLRQLESAPSF